MGEVNDARLRKPLHLPHGGVIIIEHGEILRRLVFKAAALRRDVVFQLIFKPVQVILADVEHAERVRPERLNAFKLERSGLRNDIIAQARLHRMRADRHTDVAEHERVRARRAEQFARKRRGSRLPVRAADADEFRPPVREAVTKLDLSDDLDPAGLCLLCKRSKDRHNGA